MTPYILAALALWLFQTFLAASFKTVFTDDAPAAMMDHMRGKDKPAHLSVHGARAQRAHQNLLESLVVFLPLALLLEIQGDSDGLGAQGALAFVAARAAYIPAYHLAVFGLRSTAWTIGLLGLCAMAYAALVGA